MSDLSDLIDRIQSTINKPDKPNIIAMHVDDVNALLAALEPVTVRTCATCGHPENNHPYRHPFVALAERGE